MKKQTLILFFSFLSFTVFSQTKNCEKVYDKPDTLAQYGSGRKSLSQYIQEKIIPILGDCIKQKLEFVNSMTIKFTIDAAGKVVAVDFLKPVLTEYCSTKLKAELLTMKEWKPAKVNNEKVCSVFIYPIAGIKWE